MAYPRKAKRNEAIVKMRSDGMSFAYIARAFELYGRQHAHAIYHREKRRNRRNDMNEIDQDVLENLRDCEAAEEEMGCFDETVKAKPMTSPTWQELNKEEGR